MTDRNDAADDKLEVALRNALQSPDPGEPFTQRVLNRLPPSEPAAISPQRRPTQTPRTRVVRWLSVALAASVVGGVLLQQQHAARQERVAGLAAKQQLMVALRITDEQLDLASRSLGDPTP